MSLIYAAQPVDFLTEGANDAYALYDTRLTDLTANGRVIYRPSDAFTVEATVHVGPEIFKVNQAVLDQADLVVALLIGKSIGVPAEIQYAIDQGKPVEIYTDKTTLDKSWQLAGWFSKDNVEVHVPKAQTEGAGISQLIPNTFPEYGKGNLYNPVDNLGAAYAYVAGQYGKLLQDAITPLGDGDPVSVANPGRSKRGEIIKWKKLAAGATEPRRAHTDDAGYDLFVSRETLIQPGQFIDVHTDIAVQLPSGWWGRLTGRSSTYRTFNVMVVDGVIDHGYRGELYIGVRNLGTEVIRLETGDRIGQFIPHRMFEGHAEVVAQLGSSERGDKGFGSSGR